MSDEEKETLETMQTLTSLKYGSSVVCERKDIETLLNLIEKQQKDLENSVSKEAIIRLLESEYNGIPMYELNRDYLAKNLKEMLGDD